MPKRIAVPGLTVIPRKRIHVNQHVIRKNIKTGSNDPPIGIEYPGGTKVYAHSVEIAGPSKLVYSPDKPLSCGARLWLETSSPIKFTVKYPDIQQAAFGRGELSRLSFVRKTRLKKA